MKNIKNLNIKILILFTVLGLSVNNYTYLNGNKSKSKITLGDIKAIFVTMKNKLKTKLGTMDFSSPEIKIIAPLPGKIGGFGVQIPIGSGLKNIDKGFNPVRINVLSPPMGKLNIPKFETVMKIMPDLKNSRLLNLLFNFNLNPSEKKILKAANQGVVKTVLDTARTTIEEPFKAFSKLFYIDKNNVLYLKPIQVAGIKLALLLKTYAKKDRKKLVEELPLFLAKFLNSKDEKTGKKYDDPEVLNKIIPKFVKNIIENLPLSVSLSSYLEMKDGTSKYLSELSEVWRRGSVESKTKYFLDNFIPNNPFFQSNEKKNYTEILKTAVVIVTMSKNLSRVDLSKATDERKQTVADAFERLEVIVDDFVKALPNLKVDSFLKSWKENIVLKKMKKLKSDLESAKKKGSKINFKISDLNITEPNGKKLNVPQLLSYYKGRAEQLLNYKHIGEKGYIFDFSELNKKQALFLLLGMTYRLNKDVKIAEAKASHLKSDISVEIGKKNVDLGPNAYVKRVGKAGIMSRVQRNKFKVNGSGLIFEEQKAFMALRNMKKPKPSDKKANVLWTNLKNAYVQAKSKRISAQANYALDVARGIKIEIGKKSKTPYSAFLGDLKALIMRLRAAKPLIDLLAKVFKTAGLPFPTNTIEEDLSTSGSPFDAEDFDNVDDFDAFSADEDFGAMEDEDDGDFGGDDDGY